MSTEPYLDPNLPIPDRVNDLLARLTLQEKAGQLTQYFYLGVAMNVPADVDLDALPAERRAYLEQPLRVQQAIREGRSGAVLFAKDPALINELQRIAREDTRLGIPLLVGYDVVHGLRTIFPVPIALAATWSAEINEAAQATAGEEARAVGINWTFAPMIDVARDPRWGRIVEGPGEDPVLAAKLAAAQVRGFQGDTVGHRILAGPKHLAGYGASRGGRDYDDAEVSDSELWNVYLPPFRAAADAGAANFMSAYMDLNGVPASGNRWLLTDVLRKEFGFDGFVVSDANAVRSMVTQHHASDLEDAGVRALQAGLDLEMTMFDPAYDRLPGAVEKGRVSLDELDAAVARVLTAKFRLGLFENPYVDEEQSELLLASPKSREVAERAARRSIVLLKNDDALLPLDKERLKTVAVIGRLADSRRDTIGPWVFDYDLDEVVTVLDGLRQKVNAETTVTFSPGVRLPERLYPSPFDQMGQREEHTAAPIDDDTEIERAVTAAAAADVAVVVVGEPQNHIGEKASRSTLELPGRQLEQLQRIAATGTPVVLLVMSGRPLNLQWAAEHLPAIAQVWYPGVRGGDAIAAIVFGEESPAGRLPFTWPRHVGQVPMIYGHNRTFYPDEQGERYANEPSVPQFPFGHGLSYAQFEYSNLTVSSNQIAVGEHVTLRVDVTNASNRDADEVVQVYTHQHHGLSSRPVRELKAFDRLHVPAGATRTVEFEVGPDQLRYWSAATRTWVQDQTLLDLWVGGSSVAELHTTLVITAS